MNSIYRALFVAFLLAASASTVRGAAHDGDMGMEEAAQLLEKMMTLMTDMTGCMTDASTSCPELGAMLMSEDSTEYQPTEEEFKNLCGDSCTSAVKGLGDCLSPVLQKIVDETKDIPGAAEDADLAEAQKNIDMMKDQLAPMMEETCSKCAWDDKTCMDEIAAKYEAGVVNTEEEDDAGSHATTTTFSAGIALLISIAYYMM